MLFHCSIVLVIVLFHCLYFIAYCQQCSSNEFPYRFGMLPPTVKPEYIAVKTIEAIERDQTYVVLPPWLGALLAMKPYVFFCYFPT